MNLSICSSLFLSTLAVSGPALASEPLCKHLFSQPTSRTPFATIAERELRDLSGPPVGKLVKVEIRRSRGSQPSDFYRDEAGRTWYLKSSLGHPELQTGAEVISSWIYRHFGILAPETYIVEHEGKRYSASRLLPEGQDSTLVKDMPNTAKFRALRIVAAYLKDWDRLQIGPNNRVFQDGSVAFYDFGGTLGARAQGEPKPGVPVFSPAIGGFEVPSLGFRPIGEERQWPPGQHPLKNIFDSYRVDWLPAEHPWRQMTIEDARLLLEDFRTLDSKRLHEIVSLAKYSRSQDHRHMYEALVFGRNIILEYLLKYLGDRSGPSLKSYWADQNPLPPLDFSVGENRPARISHDIKRFVDQLRIPDQHMVLFRGQESLTDKVISIAERRYVENGQVPPKQELLRKFREEVQSRSETLFQKRQDMLLYQNLTSSDTDLSWRDQVWWDRATVVDAYLQYHSGSEGSGFFVSATRSLAVATRYISLPRYNYHYRYLYVMVVPNKKTFSVIQSLMSYAALNHEEVEVAVLLDATPYVVAVYDTETGQFVRMRGPGGK